MYVNIREMEKMDNKNERNAEKEEEEEKLISEEDISYKRTTLY